MYATGAKQLIANQIFGLIQGTYIWEYDSSIESPQECWAWKNSKTNLSPPDYLVDKLKDLFVERCTDRIIPWLDTEASNRLRAVLRSMGVTDSDVTKAFQLRTVNQETTNGICCRDCQRYSTDFYLVGHRCAECHERFVVTSRLRNANSWSSSGMSQ